MPVMFPNREALTGPSAAGPHVVPATVITLPSVSSLLTKQLPASATKMLPVLSRAMPYGLLNVDVAAIRFRAPGTPGIPARSEVLDAVRCS